jgi:hypothetical protein
MNPAVHLSKARTKLKTMPISEDFKPRWIICSGVCLLAMLRHYRQYSLPMGKDLHSQRRFEITLIPKRIRRDQWMDPPEKRNVILLQAAM